MKSKKQEDLRLFFGGRVGELHRCDASLHSPSFAVPIPAPLGCLRRMSPHRGAAIAAGAAACGLVLACCLIAGSNLQSPAGLAAAAPAHPRLHRSVLRMVPPLCLSLDDVDAVAQGLEASFAKAAG